MSTLEILYSRETNSLSVTQTDISPNGCELHIGVQKEHSKEVVKFKHLKISYQLKLVDQLLLDKQFPDSNSKLLSSNQKYLTSDVLSCEPDLSYTLTVRVELDEQVCEEVIEFSTPELPPAPEPVPDEEN